MISRFVVLFFSFFLLMNESQAQDKGILPFTGIRYYNDGIRAKNIEIKADAATLLSNRLPLNKEFELKIHLPIGFDEDKTKRIFAAAEWLVTSLKGEVLYKSPNIFKENELTGFPIGSFKEISIKLSLSAALLKTDPGCTINIRVVDLKSKKQLRLDFPVTIARPGEPLQLSGNVSEIKTALPSIGKSCGLTIKNMDFTLDTTIRVAPKMAYASLDITNIYGSTISEFLSGKESFWVYDANLNEVKITDRQLKQVGGALENNKVNYLSKIPFRLKTASSQVFYIRFRWENQDKSKVIDIVVTI